MIHRHIPLGCTAILADLAISLEDILFRELNVPAVFRLDIPKQPHYRRNAESHADRVYVMPGCLDDLGLASPDHGYRTPCAADGKRFEIIIQEKYLAFEQVRP